MITAFALQEAGYVCNVSTQFLHLLRQLIEEILVVLDEPGELSTFVLAATEVETTRDEPHDPALGSLLPPMSDDPPEAANLRALTEDFLRAEKSGATAADPHRTLVCNRHRHGGDNGHPPGSVGLARCPQ